MRIQRTIAINPVEAEQMSMRVPSGMPLTLDLQYLDMNGRPLTNDVGAQLQLSARTTSAMNVYPAPATDIVNGKARVVIGGDVLNDINGYRIRLAGTYKGEPMLLALGTLRIVEAAGIEAIPSDVIDTIPLTLAYNFDCGVDIHLWQDAGKGTPFDLSTATISAAIYPAQANPTILVPFTVSTVGPGHVLLQLTQAQVNLLPNPCWWSLRASSAAGVTTLCEGEVTMTGTVGP